MELQVPARSGIAFPFAFFAGVIGLLMLPALPSAWLAFAAAALGVAGLLLGKQRGMILCGACFGAVFAGIHAHQYLEQRWPEARADDRVIGRVVIDTIPARRDAALTFDGIVTVEAPATSAQTLRVRLVSRDASFRPRAGEQWRLLLALRPPRARVNPGEVDLERHLFRDEVHALGTVVPSRLNQRIDAGHRPLTALRERIATRIDAQVVDREASALISALGVGATGSMSREQWRVFNATGTTHLVAISGLHVTLFAVVAFAVARGFWFAIMWRFTRWPRDSFAAAAAFGAAAAYAAVAGLSVPTQRTLIMLGVWLLLRSGARAASPFQSFAVALLVVLLWDPFAPLSAGFWLSFAAMAAIILVTSTRFVRRRWVHEALAVQGVVLVALVPLSLASFGSVSVVGVLVNGVAIPAMSWVFVPVILLAIVLMPLGREASDASLAVAEWMHHQGWPWLVAAADLPWALVHATPPLWWFFVAAVGVAVGLTPWPLAIRIASLICTLPLAALTPSAPRPGTVEVTVLDAGEGTSVILRTARHVLVYGTGDGYGTEGRTAETVLVPALRSLGVSRIDTLVLSRLSPANSAGVTALLAQVAVKETLVPGPSPLDLEGARTCSSAPREWRWDGVLFRLPEADGSVSGGVGRECVVAVEVGQNAGAVAQASVREQWSVVSGRRRPHHDAAMWTTSESGAIRFVIDPARGLTDLARARAAPRRLWRGSP